MFSPETTAALLLAGIAGVLVSNVVGVVRVWKLTKPEELKPLHGTAASQPGSYSYLAYWLKQEMPAGVEVEVFRVKDPTVRRRSVRIVIHDRDGVKN